LREGIAIVVKTEEQSSTFERSEGRKEGKSLSFGGKVWTL